MTNKTIEELVEKLVHSVISVRFQINPIEREGLPTIPPVLWRFSDDGRRDLAPAIHTALTKAYEAGQVEERKNSEQVIGAVLYSANHHHAVYVNDEALLEKYDIEKRIDHSSLRSVFIANLATLKAKTDI